MEEAIAEIYAKAQQLDFWQLHDLQELIVDLMHENVREDWAKRMQSKGDAD